MLPPAVSGAVNGELTPDITASEPVAPLKGFEEVTGNWVRIDGGTVNDRAPAVVEQTNVQVSKIWLVPDPVMLVALPVMITRSEALPPVQLSGSPAARTTVAGRPPVTVSGDPMLTLALNLPTSLPPAPATVYVPPTRLTGVLPGRVNPPPSKPRLME